MKKLIGYLKGSVYHIRRNKLYSAFYVVGTALAFVFIILILQFVKLISTATPPNVNADRIISIEMFRDKQGHEVGIRPAEMEQFFRQVNPEKYSYQGVETISGEINGQPTEFVTHFVGGDYFDMYQYDFVSGRAFSKEEVGKKDKVVVIKEDVARECFPQGDAVGKEISFQGNTYQIIGVVKNFSIFSMNNGGASLWVPASFNKFVPSMRGVYWLNMQFPAGMAKEEMRKKVLNSVRAFFDNKNVELNISEKDIVTDQEAKMDSYFTGYIRYGLWGVLVLLLFIPALNIVVLSSVQGNSREEEMAIKKAIGAPKSSVFMQLLSENLLLVLVGLLLGCICCVPMVTFIQRYVMGDLLARQMSLLAGLDASVILLQVLPLALLFTLLSGGIPAYVVAKKNIASSLKGGNKV